MFLLFFKLEVALLETAKNLTLSVGLRSATVPPYNVYDY